MLNSFLDRGRKIGSEADMQMFHWRSASFGYRDKGPPILVGPVYTEDIQRLLWGLR